MAVSVSHQLIGLLAGGIEAHRVVNAVLLRKRHARVAAIDRTAAGVHQMLNPVMAATFQDVTKTHKVGLDVSGWVFNRVTHSRLGRQVHHLLRHVLSEGGVHSDTIFQIRFDQMKRRARAQCGGLQLGNPGSLESSVVIGVDVVKPYYRMTLLKQARAEVKADETSSAGDENSHQFLPNTQQERQRLQPIKNARRRLSNTLPPIQHKLSQVE